MEPPKQPPTSDEPDPPTRNERFAAVSRWYLAQLVSALPPEGMEDCLQSLVEIVAHYRNKGKTP